MEGKDKFNYGQWLKAEVREHSPYWRAFYESDPTQDGAEEVIPETPQDSTLLLPLIPHNSEQQQANMEVSKNLPGDQSTFNAAPREDMALKLKAPIPNPHEISKDPDAGSSKSKKPVSMRQWSISYDRIFGLNCITLATLITRLPKSLHYQL